MSAFTPADNDFRSVLPRFTPEAMKANQALVDLIKIEGERYPPHLMATTGR